MMFQAKARWAVDAAALIASVFAAVLVWRSRLDDEIKPQIIAVSTAWAFGEANWIDEDTVVFTGLPGDKTWKNGYPPPTQAYVWRIGGKDELLPTGDDKVWRACSDDGNPAYYSERGKVIWLTTWRGGHRNVVEVPPPSGGAQADIRHKTRCRKNEDKRMDGRAWVANAAGDVYLDFGSREDVLYKSTSRDIKIARKSDLHNARAITLLSPIYPTSTLTPKWDNSFVLWDETVLFSHMRESFSTIPVYRVHSNGTVQETRLVNAKALWSSSLMAYRDGYLSVTTGDGEPKLAGLYLVNEKKATRILRGYMSQPAVSPSGCRLAVNDSMGPHGKELFASRLKIIDLCAAQ